MKTHLFLFWLFCITWDLFCVACIRQPYFAIGSVYYLHNNLFCMYPTSSPHCVSNVQVRSEKSFHAGQSLRHGCVQMAPRADSTGWDQTMASPSLTTSCLRFSPFSSVSPWRAGLTYSTMYVTLTAVLNRFTHLLTSLFSTSVDISHTE